MANIFSFTVTAQKGSTEDLKKETGYSLEKYTDTKYWDNNNIKSTGTIDKRRYGNPNSYRFILLQIGEWKYYYRTGDLQKVVVFNDYGVPVGKEIEYHKNGNIKTEIFWPDSTEHHYKENIIKDEVTVYGKAYHVKMYDKKGKLAAEGNYLDHKGNMTNRFEHGTWKYYDKKGNVYREAEFNKGMLIKERFFE